MAYEPNTTHWPIGALVIHAADRKVRDMLMRVEGYAPDGRALTRYIYPRCDMSSPRSSPTLRGELPNGIARLLDPARFGIDTQEAPR